MERYEYQGGGRGCDRYNFFIPQRFPYPVKGNIKGSPESFDSLDVDSGEIYRVKAGGTLRIGLEQKIQSPIRTGVFLFKNADLDSIISDLTYIESKRDVGSKHSVRDGKVQDRTEELVGKIFNLTLAILYKTKAEMLALHNRNGEALTALDEAIKYFQRADAKMYATSISRLYKLKAGIYKSLHNQEQFQENINHSFQALMKASKYYELMSQGRYAFLQSLTAEERYLLTATKFFQAGYGEAL